MGQFSLDGCPINFVVAIHSSFCCEDERLGSALAKRFCIKIPQTVDLLHGNVYTSQKFGKTMRTTTEGTTTNVFEEPGLMA